MINPTEKDIGRKIMWVPSETGWMSAWAGQVFFGAVKGLKKAPVGDGKHAIECDFGQTWYWADLESLDWADDL